MYLQIGQRPYGKCDVVPELFYVATWFFHVNFFPLVPLGSRLILSRTGSTYQTVRIPFSFKSLFYAWVRTAFFGAMLAAAFWVIITATDDRERRDTGLAIPIIVASFCAIVYAFVMIYPRRKMPSYQRACKLAQLASLNEKGWAALNVLYGRDPFARPDDPTVTDVLKA
ncbi:MAG TPA: hypothetical protein VGN88_13690 [Phycisphaerae bacterium]|jgi:hypothetical protein